MTTPVLNILDGHPKDLGGGFVVRRLLPAATRRAVGPFVFFDHFGPVRVTPEAEHDVRPHPHIGLATVTYLFEGAMMHRDSLGSGQLIEPGAVNWMTAGRGIVHSERRPEALRHQTYVNHGLQLWVALPREHEEAEPAFMHTAAADIPEVRQDDAVVRVLVGAAFGAHSPVATFAPTLYLDVQLRAGGRFTLPSLVPEQAVYSVQGDLLLDGQRLSSGCMAVLQPGEHLELSAGVQAVRAVVIGGAPLDGPRHMWWNFVSSRKERIVQAAQAWEAQRFAPVPGETAFIPLPERRFTT